MISLTVEYPSESGAPWSGEEGGESPPPTTVHWDLGGQPCSCTALVHVVGLVSATPSATLALPGCWGALPTSCPKESDSPAFMTGISWTGFLVQLCGLLQLEVTMCFMCGSPGNFARDCPYCEAFKQWHQEQLNTKGVGENLQPTPRSADTQPDVNVHMIG